MALSYFPIKYGIKMPIRSFTKIISSSTHIKKKIEHKLHCLVENGNILKTLIYKKRYAKINLNKGTETIYKNVE